MFLIAILSFIFLTTFLAGISGTLNYLSYHAIKVPRFTLVILTSLMVIISIALIVLLVCIYTLNPYV